MKENIMKAKLDIDQPFNINIEDTADNSTRIPVMVLCDVSASMYGQALVELKSSLQKFIEYLADDDFTRVSVELAIATYSSTVKLIQPYAFADDIYFDTDFDVEDATYMHSAVEYGLESLKDKIKEYKQNGDIYRAPLLVLISS